jgi:hypothetical protein
MIIFKLIDENKPNPQGYNDYTNNDWTLKLDFKDFDEFDEFTYDDQDYEVFMDEMECGSHPWCGVHDYFGDEGCIGFSSYEIKDFKTAIKKWEEFFKSKGKLI